MMMRKRTRGLVISLIGICVTLLTITSCSSKEKPSAEIGAGAKLDAIRLEYWTPFSGGDNQFMTQMVNQFNDEHPHIHITQVNSRLDDYYSRLRTAIMSGNAPDIAILHQTSLPQFVKNGYIESLEETATSISLDWSGFNENVLDSVVYDGEPYAVPLDTHALVLYYNKTYLREAGLLDREDKPRLDSGAAGFETFLKKLKDTVPQGVAPMAQPSTRIDSVWLWWSLYNQIDGGGKFYNEELTAAVFDNPQALEALNFVNDLYDKELIPPDINDAFKLFYDGNAAVLVTGMWGTGAFEQAAGLDFGVIPFPVLYDRPAVWGDSHTLVIPKRHSMTLAKKQAALTFSKWLVEHSEMWAEAGHVPSLTEVVESEAFSQLKYRSDYAATADYVAYWPRHSMQWSMVEYLIHDFEKMIFKQQTPQQALEAAVRRVNTELRK